MMKNVFMLCGFCLLIGLTAFCQKEETNGTIYIKHPYIDMVMKANKEYAANDFSSTKKYYSDTAKYWQSGMKEPISVDDAITLWKSDFDNFDDIKMKQVGYPDLFHYKKGDKWTVQSYWEWSGKSKKSGEVETVMLVIFDEINKDGKIAREYNLGDFSKLN